MKGGRHLEVLKWFVLLLIYIMGGTPSIYDYEHPEEQLDECDEYTAANLFCCSYAPYFWEAIKIRYPDYVE